MNIITCRSNTPLNKPLSLVFLIGYSFIIVFDVIKWKNMVVVHETRLRIRILDHGIVLYFVVCDNHCTMCSNMNYENEYESLNKNPFIKNSV